MAIKDYPTTTTFHEIDSFHPQPHSGTDYALPLYTPLEAISDGVITGVSTNDMLGNNIRYKTPDGKVIVYGHLAEFDAKVGDQIHQGQIIAKSGGLPGMQGAGHSTGPHLHLSIYNSSGTLVDPTPYVLNGIQSSNQGSPFVIPVLLILMLVIIYKFKKVFAYGFGIFAILTILFIVS
ncbi:MAG TPA: M23 family metallopeptidase [Clostridium sp.]